MSKRAGIGGRKKGTPKTGGRKKGTPNRHTAEVKELAQNHGPECIERLVEIAKGDNVPAAVAACKELLDRGWGKAVAAIEVSGQVSLLDCFAALAAREAAQDEDDPDQPDSDAVH